MSLFSLSSLRQFFKIWFYSYTFWQHFLQRYWLFTIISSAHTDSIIPGLEDQVPYLAICCFVPRVTSIHLHINKHGGHIIWNPQLRFTINPHLIDKLIIKLNYLNIKIMYKVSRPDCQPEFERFLFWSTFLTGIFSEGHATYSQFHLCLNKCEVICNGLYDQRLEQQDSCHHRSQCFQILWSAEHSSSQQWGSCLSRARNWQCTLSQCMAELSTVGSFSGPALGLGGLLK